MTKKISVYLSEEHIRQLNMYENKSKTVNDALAHYFSNTEYFKMKKQLIEKRIQIYQTRIDKEKIKLEFIEKQLDLIEKRKTFRPEGYKDVVELLKNLPKVDEDDFIFQANRLHASSYELINWLKYDGYYDEIIG